MPAQSGDGISPAVKSVLSNPVAKWFTDRLLLLVASVFLLILLFVIGLSGPGKNALREIFNVQQQNLGLGNASKLFENSLDSERFNEFMSSDELAKAFIYLSDEYNRSPSNNKREALIKLADYMQMNLPDQAKLVNLDIPCRQKSCGTVTNYTDDLLNIKKGVDSLNSADESEKQAILFNIENAAVSNGKDGDDYFNNLNSIFQKLRDIWEREKDVGAKNLAASVLELMQQASPEHYELLLKNNSLTL